VTPQPPARVHIEIHICRLCFGYNYHLFQGRLPFVILKPKMKSRPLWNAVIFGCTNQQDNQEALLTTTYNCYYSPWVETSCLQHSIVLDTRHTQTAVGMGSSRDNCNCNIQHKIAPCKGHASFPEGEHTATFLQIRSVLTWKYLLLYFHW
jgi:hypothetical protein